VPSHLAGKAIAIDALAGRSTPSSQSVKPEIHALPSDNPHRELMKPLPGSAFRDQIASLLRIQYSKVNTEVRLKATTADVIFVDDTQPLFPRTIAIEAKDWDSPLNSSQIATIHNLYAPSLHSSEIAHLWIIGRHPLSSSPKQTVDSLSNVVFSTFEQFKSGLINFTPLLQNNVHLFQHDESYDNFVETRVRSSSRTLLEEVDDWLLSDQNGLIVYGGYGLGKTTFSKYLACTLSNRRLIEHEGRIPIRLTLGDIYYKQDLVSLITSSLAGAESGVQVRDFSYGAFLEMNRLGQFVLIFDGFDEMRHAMDLDDFIFNFEQFKPLFAPKAKIVILGRPDAFLSNAEELRVLSSLFDTSADASSKLRPVEVGFFSPEEVDAYLTNFLSKRSRPLTTAENQRFQSILQMLPATPEDNILSRPVQLKMFTKVMDDFLESEIQLTRYELYNRFIYQFIKREERKKARELSREDLPDLPHDERAQFMHQTAWWILTAKKENRFLASEISADIIPAGIKATKRSEASLREALLGSVIEPMDHSGVLGQKARKYYFFPHKSYIEFLVAQYFSYGKFSIDKYRVFMSTVTPEIVSFLREGPTEGLDNLRLGLDHTTSEVPKYVIQAAARASDVGEETTSNGVYKLGPGRVYTHYVFLRENGLGVLAYLQAQIRQEGPPNRLSALINCIGSYLSVTGDTGLARALVLNFLTTAVGPHGWKDYVNDGKIITIYHNDSRGAKAGALYHTVTVDCSRRRLLLSTDRLMEYSLFASSGAVSVRLEERAEYHQIKLSESFLTSAAPAEAAAAIAAILNDRKQRSSLPIALMGQAKDRYSLSS
jgi:hypothetical protein